VHRWRSYANSFQDNFTKIREYQHNNIDIDIDIEVRSNPPYGGDKINKQVGEISSLEKQYKFNKEQLSICISDLLDKIDNTKFKSTISNITSNKKSFSLKSEFNKIINKLKTILKSKLENEIFNVDNKTIMNKDINNFIDKFDSLDELKKWAKEFKPKKFTKNKKK